MKSLLASVAFGGAVLLALASARAQTTPNVQPSMCPTPSASNSLVDSTLQQNCMTPTPLPTKAPKPSPSPKPVATQTPAAAEAPPSAPPQPKPTT